MIFILDVSKWQNPAAVPWGVLWDLGFRLVIIKASMGGGIDTNCREHARIAREHGFKVGFYHWVDPIQDWIRQAYYFHEMIYELEPVMLAYDVEQWWANWQKWQDYVDGKIPNSQVPRTTAEKVINSYLTVRNLTLDKFGQQIPEKRHLTYTAVWVDDMFPGLAEAMNGHQMWIADWNYSHTIVYSNFGGNFRLSQSEWEQWQAMLWDELADGAYDGIPLLLDGHTDKTLRAWQVDSSVIPPGAPGRLDISIFNGSLNDFNAWLDEGTPPPPPPPPPPPDPNVIEELWEAIEELRGWLDVINSNMVTKEDLIKAEIVNPVLLGWLEEK